MNDMTQHQAQGTATPLVSVIVPVYNVENYLDRCVESLVSQTLKDIEIILIDDGSTDNSPALCDDWAQRDSRIRVVHKENGGPSEARNLGVALAQSEWIGFVDSDDYVTTEMYQVLYEAVMRNDADIATCGTYSVYNDHVVLSSETGSYTLTGVEALKETLVGDKLRIWLVVKLYAKKILLNAPLPVGRTYEDAYIQADLYTQAKTVAVDSRPQYYYWHREGTITTEAFTSKTMDIVFAFEHVFETVMQKCPELKTEAEFRLYWSRFVALDKMLLTRGVGKCAEEKAVVAYLRAHSADIQANPYIGRGRKLAMRVLNLSVRAYKLFAKANARNYQAKQE